jgi:predicted ATPase
MEVAQRLAPTFAGGAVIVELTSVSEPEAIVGTIAAALQLPLPGQGWPGLAVALRRQLHHRGLLLVLDNFEHLLDEAPQLIQLLEAAPGLSVVVTSRERLKLHAEQVVLLQGLPYSGWDTVADAERDPAVQLFLHHARQVRSSFALRREHLAPLRAIVESVEGMPLGIILAAAWAEVMGLAEIVAEIRSSLDFLEAPYRDLPPRQRSMRALLESTWVRLDSRERRLFAGLSVFRAGFTTEAAQKITEAIARDLRRFVDCSMLARADGGRFAMHQLWRQFAAGKLSRSPEEEAEMLERHAVYYARFLGQRSAAFKDERAEQAGAEIAAEFENARAAWNWAADRGRVSLLEQGLILGFYCIRQGRLLEGAVMTRRAAEALAGVDSGPARRLLGFLLAAYVSFTDSGMPPADVRETLAEARAHLAAAGALGENVCYEKAFVLMIWGQVLIREDYLKAREVLAESLSLLEAVEAWFEAANVTSALARSYQVQRDYGAALDYAGKALRLWERIGERHWISVTRMQLGVIQTRLGRVVQGVDAIRESLALFSAAGNEYFAAQAQLTLGEVLVDLGRFDEALSLLSRGHAYFSGIDMADVSRAAWCWAALHQGHYDEVQRQARVLPANQGDIGFEAAISEQYLLQGCAALALGNLEEAVSLLRKSADEGKAAGEKAGADAARLSQILALWGSALVLTGAGAAAEGAIAEALRWLQRPYPPQSAAAVLSAVSLLLAEKGAGERALAIYEAARSDPYVANSHWFEAVFGRRLPVVAATLPEETLRAARERGRAVAWRELVDALLADPLNALTP